MPQACFHNNFESDVHVRRLFKDASKKGDPTAMPDQFTLELTVFCSDCGRRFEFQNLTTDRSLDHAFVMQGGTKVSLPIAPGVPVSGG